MTTVNFNSYSMYTKVIPSGNKFYNLMKQAENQEEPWTSPFINNCDTIKNQWFREWNSTRVQVHSGRFGTGTKQETIKV